jgi:hypothetical protein
MSSYRPEMALSTDELRAAVRAVLREVLPTELANGATLGGAAPVEHVALRTDADLDAFLRRVASLCEDPTRRAALKDGRHGFRLAGATGATGATDRGSTSGTHGAAAAYLASGVMRVERGAVTERTVAKAAADGARLVLGAKAVLTPLARDKARVLGVEIEKER